MYKNKIIRLVSKLVNMLVSKLVGLHMVVVGNLHFSVNWLGEWSLILKENWTTLSLCIKFNPVMLVVNSAKLIIHFKKSAAVFKSM
jgi:uncharacterized YccA/Bax inhibitor family protein